jgi:hypothetical protein
MIEYYVHDIAKYFPRCTDEQRAGLKASIRKRGVALPLVLWQDPDRPGEWGLIDGITRSEVVAELLKEGVKKADNGRPIKLEWMQCEARTAGEALEFAECLNLHRRDLTSWQRACVAVRSGKLFLAYQAKAAADFGCEEVADEEDAYKRVTDLVAESSGTNREYVCWASRISKYPDILDQGCAGTLSFAQSKKAFSNRESETTDDAPPDGDSPGDPEPVYDAENKLVDDDLRDVFLARDRFLDAIKPVSTAIKTLNSLVEEDAGKLMHRQELLAFLKNGVQHVKDHLPHVTCPYCGGSGKNTETVKGKCPSCDGVKFLDRIQWKAVTEDVRKKAGYAKGNVGATTDTGQSQIIA